MAYLKTRGTRLHTAWGDLGRPARTLLAGRLQPVPECRVSPRVGFGPTLRPSYFPLHAGTPAENRGSKGPRPVYAPSNWAGASSAPALRALTGDGTRGRALATGGHWAQRPWLRATWRGTSGAGAGKGRTVRRWLPGGQWAQRARLPTTCRDAPAQLLPPPRRHNRGYPGFLGPGTCPAPGNWAGASYGAALRAPAWEGKRAQALATRRAAASKCQFAYHLARRSRPVTSHSILAHPRKSAVPRARDPSPHRVTGLERRLGRHFGRQRREGTRSQALATRRAETAISRARTSTRPPACRRPCRGPRGV